MIRNLRRAVWMRGLATSLLLVGFFATPSQADTTYQNQISRIAVGLISAGANPSDAMDLLVNLQLCAGLSDYDKAQACVQPYLNKVGLKSLSDLDLFTGVIGHFSVWESVTHTAGGMDIVPTSSNSMTQGTRTDAQGKTVTFEFYLEGGNYTEFEYRTDTDRGSGYLYWVDDCTLVGPFFSAVLTDSNGNQVSGTLVALRCASPANRVPA